ncbi:putative oxidoreductase YdgJ [Planctopirus ephydatiae]|uniref:Putative oxidoreductase YdgJ n=2 Tax=Planctopirus ephydatiae TaxID=2528019 RepID=A0A518GTU5_9PLAN|nr:putative oxidoreductase YdgJ [Planctopirus ephydatiae]
MNGNGNRRDALRIMSAAMISTSMAGRLSAIEEQDIVDKQTNKSPLPRIKIGQIGVGHAHADKLAVYRNSPDYEVVGIVEPDEKLRLAAQNKPAFKDLPWMTREELLAQPGLQSVLIETEVRHLLDQAEACISAGQHVHLDKPAGESLEQYRRILQNAERQSLLVQMGYMFRYNPGYLLLKKFIQQGWLGEIFEVHAVMSKVLDPRTREQLGAYPGGIMFELGCHVIDLVLNILPQPDRITSFSRQVVTGQDRLFDNMLAVFEYPKATATIRSTGVEVEGFARRHVTVCGTRGTFHIQPLDNPSVRLSLAESVTDPDTGKVYRKGVQEIELPKYARYVGDADDMAKIIRGDKPSDYSYAHDLAVQTAVLQASGLLKSH